MTNPMNSEKRKQKKRRNLPLLSLRPCGNRKQGNDNGDKHDTTATHQTKQISSSVLI